MGPGPTVVQGRGVAPQLLGAVDDRTGEQGVSDSWKRLTTAP
ncbi:hypothetical protein ACFQZK_06975 [Rhodococcus aetherivorans]